VNILPIKSNNQISFRGNPSKKLADCVADIFMSYRRPFKSESVTQSDIKYLHNRISSEILPFIERGEQIPVVLVGFSMKSPSPLKTISQNADRAEFETLKHLDNITKKVSSVYPEGSDFQIYADGRIFVNSIVGSSDGAVTKYVAQLRNFLKKLGSKDIKLIALEDYYKGDYNGIRKQLFSDFFVDRQKMEQDIEHDPFLKEYKTFMRDFYAKDIRAIDPSKSIRQSRREGAEVAMKVICAAESLDRYIKSVFNGKMFRISVHAKPVYDLYNKVGIYMNAMKKNFAMPWHTAALRTKLPDNSDCFIYEKKFLLDKAGYSIVPDLDGKGVYYELPEGFNHNPNLSFKENLLLNQKVSSRV